MRQPNVRYASACRGLTQHSSLEKCVNPMSDMFQLVVVSPNTKAQRNASTKCLICFRLSWSNPTRDWKRNGVGRSGDSHFLELECWATVAASRRHQLDCTCHDS